MSDFPPDVMARYMTNRAIEQTTVALLDQRYIVRLVHREGYSLEHPTISRDYTVGDLRKPGTTKYLRYMNWQGYHIFFRPEHPGYIRIDDLCEDDVDRMREDGIEPCAVIETSEGLFHAWVKLMRRRSIEITSAENGAAARLLAERYGGDMGATGANQLGRLPGFRNIKECYEDNNGGYPLVFLRSKRGRSAPDWLLEEVREAAKTEVFLGSTPTGWGDIETDAIAANDAAATYMEAVQNLTARFPDMQTDDRSRLDFSVARWLALRGFSVSGAIAVLMAGSEKAKVRGTIYVSSTVERAFDNR